MDFSSGGGEESRRPPWQPVSGAEERSDEAPETGCATRVAGPPRCGRWQVIRGESAKLDRGENRTERDRLERSDSPPGTAGRRDQWARAQLVGGADSRGRLSGGGHRRCRALRAGRVRP